MTCIFLHSIFLKTKKCTNYITIKYIIKYTSYRCQLLRVSASRCHHQGVSQQQMFVGPTSISGNIRPHTSIIKVQSLIILKFKLHTHTCAILLYHTTIRLPYNIFIAGILPGLCVQKNVAINYPKALVQLKHVV